MDSDEGLADWFIVSVACHTGLYCFVSSHSTPRWNSEASPEMHISLSPDFTKYNKVQLTDFTIRYKTGTVKYGINFTNCL